MMAHTIWQRLRWYGYRCFERMDMWGLIGGLLVIGVVITYFFWLRPLQERLVMLNEATNKTKHGMVVSKASPQALLNNYINSLPDISERAFAVQTLIQLAEQRNLTLGEVTYKTEARQGEPLAYYHMRFSLFASYPEIQGFLSQLLHDLNYVSIESLSLSRETVEDEVIEAHIDLMFHFNQLSQGVQHGH